MEVRRNGRAARGSGGDRGGLAAAIEFCSGESIVRRTGRRRGSRRGGAEEDFFVDKRQSSHGRPLRSRRQSEKLDKHVRLVPLAPSVTVAEWLRHATVDRSKRVRFSPVTPFHWEVV